MFLCSVISMPERLTVYTTLVGLLNSKNHNAGGEVIKAYAVVNFDKILSFCSVIAHCASMSFAVFSSCT